MEHWQFFVAILILLFLLQPAQEYFTENDANTIGQRISEMEIKNASLNNVYDTNKLLDISSSLINLRSRITPLNSLQIAQSIATLQYKLSLLQQVRTNTTTLYAPTRSKEAPVSYTFYLPVGTWLVTADVVYIPADKYIGQNIDSQIGVAINPKPYDNVSGYNSIRDFNHIEFPRTVGINSCFSVSATIQVSDANTIQTISVYDGNGIVKLNVISRQIGFQTA